MQRPNTLIRTKLRLPLTRPGLVPRPRLEARLAEGLRGPLTLITAPAGFGKTTLVASCIAACAEARGMRAAWLSLDKEDNQSGRFLSYLVAALQAANPAVAGEAARLLELSEAPPEALLTSLVNDLDAAGQELALVLDDYQFINSQAAHEQTAFLLQHCPPTFHLVIAARSDPPLPLSRMRARGQVVELRAADLRFTVDEAAQFLNEVMGLRLDPGLVTVLEERTEGWIAGLQMAALSMRDRQDVSGFVAGFSGTNRYILDYLLEEVLAGQPPEIQRFLLYTSVLERLSAPLCDAVLSGDAVLPAPAGPPISSPSAAVLARLEQANLFLVPLDDERIWYRYHHLFADLLRARLYQSEPARAALLLSRAAAWCEREGLVPGAVSYALAARDYPRAVDLISRYWGLFASQGQIETIHSWLASLPQDLVRGSAALSVAFCWVLWLDAQLGEIEPHLVDAERALDRPALPVRPAAPIEPGAELPAMVATLRSIVARYHLDFPAATAYAERALTLVPKGLPAWEHAQVRSLIFLALGSAYDGVGNLEGAVDAYGETIRLSRLGKSATGVSLTVRLIGLLRVLGRLSAAETACGDALRFVEEQGMSHLPAAGVLYVAMAELLLERNQVEDAEASLARGVELGRRSGRFDAVRNTAPVMVRLRLLRGDVSAARSAVQETETAFGETHPPMAIAELLALKARILLQQGSLEEAARSAEEAVRLAGQDRGQTGEMAALAALRVMLARSAPEEAVAQLARSLTSAETSGRLGTAIELRILRALALARGGDQSAAEADLERALTLARPQGYVRAFLDEGQPLRVLLARWLSQAQPGPLRDYAARLLSQFDSEPRVISSAPR